MQRSDDSRPCENHPQTTLLLGSLQSDFSCNARFSILLHVLERRSSNGLSLQCGSQLDDQHFPCSFSVLSSLSHILDLQHTCTNVVSFLQCIYSASAKMHKQFFEEMPTTKAKVYSTQITLSTQYSIIFNTANAFWMQLSPGQPSGLPNKRSTVSSQCRSSTCDNSLLDSHIERSLLQTKFSGLN